MDTTIIILVVLAVVLALTTVVLARMLVRSADEKKMHLAQISDMQREAFQKETALREESHSREVELQNIIASRETALASQRGQTDTLSAKITALETTLAERQRIIEEKNILLQEKDKELEKKETERIEAAKSEAEARHQQEERFRNIATEILEGNARRFTESSSQRITDLLNPLKENIENFRKVINDTYANDSRERTSLQSQLKQLMELNQSIGHEARELTRALRNDSKVQGDWGEMILERLLEKSGLVKGKHFDVQVTKDVDGSPLRNDDGKGLRADVVIYYPDDRCLVIDSKVSLTAFVNYINLADDDADTDGSLRRQAGEQHVASVRGHINELAHTKYQDVIGRKRMDFVIMFIPNEAAYIAAMQIEPGLWQEAYDKRVLMVSPTQLISVLKMLEQLWRQDAVNKNVEEIARLAGTMLDKFTNSLADFSKVETALQAAQTAYSECRKKLSDGKGNLFVTAQKIQALGAKTTKQLPEK